MRIIILTLLLSINFASIYSQNEKTNREGFSLKLPVDGEQYYEQQVEPTPYFVKEKVLQIYPGEKLFIEVEVNKKEITSMKVVKENLNPNKTIEIKLSQTVEDNKNKGTMLKITNPFKKDLEYKAMMFIVGHDQWVETNVFPIQAELTGYEMWSDVIITLVLSDWKLK